MNVSVQVTQMIINDVVSDLGRTDCKHWRTPTTEPANLQFSIELT